jgi:vitamin B12 transporter
LVALLLGAAVPPGRAAAATLPQAGTTLSPVVVTATRVPTPAEDIPAGVTVITRAEMQRRGDNTLTDALAGVPGLRVSQSGGPGGAASVFIRGTNSDAVLVLRDGMPINDSADASGAFNFGIDTLADVARIEIIRGPMASLYGSGAIGGVINIITRRGHRPGPHVTMDLAGGYPKQVRASAALTGTGAGFDYALIAASESLRGYDSTPQRMSVYTGTPQGYREHVVTLNLGYTPVPGTRFSLLLRGRRAVFGFNALGSPIFDDANSTGRDASLLGRIGVHSLLAEGVWETGLFLGRLQDDRRYTEPLNPADPNQTSSDQRYHGYRTDLQWNNTLHLSDLFTSTVLSDAALTFGFERTADTAKVRVGYSFAGFPYSENADAAMTDTGFYGGLQGRLWRRLTITGQIRHDAVLNDHALTWRLGAVLDAPALRTRFKAAYGTAFRAPSLFDRYGVDSFGYVGNPNLQPERAQGWEVGFRTTLPGFGQPDFVAFGATYFNEQVNNLIVAVFNPVDTAENVGSAHIQGVETSLHLHPAGWLALDASWTYTQPENADTGALLLRRPQNTAAADARIRPLPRLSIVPEVVFTGAFQDYLNNDAGFSTGAVGTSGQGLIANLTITYRLARRARLYLNATNLFDSRFEPVNGYQTPGPNVIAGVRLSL